MASTTITALTAVLAGDLDDTALVAVDDNDSNTRKATIAQLRTQLNTGAQTFTGAVTLQSTLDVTGTTAGVMGIAGNRYSHVMVAVGYQNDDNPLNEDHQVGVYSAVLGNQYARGVSSFVAAFESAVGTSTAAGELDLAVSYSTGDVGLGGTSTIGRTIAFMTNAAENSGNLGNAQVSDFATSDSFTGEWFIYYAGVLPSYIGGELAIGPEVYRTANDSYLRLYGGTEGNGATLLLYGGTGANANQVYFSGSAGVFLTGPTTITGTLGTTSTAAFGGNVTVGQEFSRAVDNDFLRIAGGTAGSGAAVVAYGGTHATLANQLYLNGTGGVTITATTGGVTMSGIPTSNPGGTGKVWSDGGTLKIT